ncbi:MAG: DUF805 domain-containing protein [Caldimonas sp.]
MDVTTHRFAAPAAVVGDVDVGVQPVRLWPPTGRMGRMRFLAYGMGVWLLAMVFSFLFGLAAGFAGMSANYVSVAITLVYFFLAALVVIQRSHDMDLSAWMSLLTLIPFVGLYWLFKAGTPGSNRFGAPPPPNSTIVTVVAWIGIGLIALGLLGIVLAFVFAFPAVRSALQ